MSGLIILIAFVACAFSAALFLLFSFFLLPWARQRMGGYALGLIPLSTFAGAYVGWAVIWLLMQAAET